MHVLTLVVLCGSLLQRESGDFPQLVVVAASLWPTGGTVWSKAVRRSALKKLLTSMERAVSDGLHQRTAGLEDRTVWVDTVAERLPTLVDLLTSLGPSARVMVFVATPAEVDFTSRHLRSHLSGGGADINSDSVENRPAEGPWRVGAFHAKRPRGEQEVVLARFSEQGKGGCVLVCTDALARGIDLGGQSVDVVVQLGPAENGSNHLHRVGRTARQGAAGVAVTIACRDVALDAPRVEFLGRRNGVGAIATSIDCQTGFIDS